MIFPKVNELPFKQFEKIGLNYNSVLALNNSLLYLLTFRRTNLLTIKNPNISDPQAKEYIKAKLSLYFDKGQYHLKVHPVQRKMKNIFKLSYGAVLKLKKDQTVVRLIDFGGIDKWCVFQRDQETNEMLRVFLSDINLDFSKKEIAEIKRSACFYLNGFKLKINLTHPKGYTKY